VRLHDVITGPAIALCGAGLWAWSFTLPVPNNADFGPGTFPRLMGGGLALAGVGVAVSGWLRGRGPLIQRPDWLRSGPQFARFAAILGAIALYPLISGALGFLLTAWLLLFVLMVVNGIRPLPALGAGLAISAFVNIAFASILHVPLPWGPLTPISGYLIW